MNYIKRKIILIILFVFFAFSLSAQELVVFEYQEPFGRFKLTLNYDTSSSTRNYYFFLSYLGEDYQFYRSITLNIDGNNHWILFTNITQDWSGYSTETYRTGYISDETKTALLRAKNVVFTIDSVRFNRDDTFSLPNDSLAHIKQYIR
jgi:hypothetical protein